jgi:hypothetical protein
MALAKGRDAMRIYWSHKSLPEFANVPPEDRKRVWKLCQAKANRHPISWALAGAYFLGMVTCPFFLPTIRRVIRIEEVIANPLLTGLVLGSVIFGPWIVATRQIHMWLARKHIATELPGHCSRCGYDLTGNVSGNCPECGAAL